MRRRVRYSRNNGNYGCLSYSIPQFLTSLSLLSLLAIGRMGIKIQSLQWRSDGETEAKTYGNATLPGTRTVDDTRKYIDDFLKDVSLEVCFRSSILVIC
jgi:hypothetical protein